MGFFAVNKQLESGLYGAVGNFADEQELLQGIEKVRAQGYSKLEAYTGGRAKSKPGRAKKQTSKFEAPAA